MESLRRRTDWAITSQASGIPSAAVYSRDAAIAPSKSKHEIRRIALLVEN